MELTLNEDEIWVAIRDYCGKKRISVYKPDLKAEIDRTGQITKITFSSFKTTDENGMEINK